MTMLEEKPRTDDAERDGESRDDHDADDGHVTHRSILSASPLIWLLLVVAAGWGVWSTATKGSGKPTPARAVVVPADSDADRTVAALPCAALSTGRSKQAPQGVDTVVLPRGSGERVVLVPSCGSSGGAGSSGGSSSGSSRGGAVIVLPPGTPPPSAGDKLPLGGSGSGSSGAKAQVQEVFRLPDSSRAQTLLVVPSMGGKGGGKGSQKQPQPPVPESGRGLAMSPPCSTG